MLYCIIEFGLQVKPSNLYRAIVFFAAARDDNDYNYYRRNYSYSFLAVINTLMWTSAINPLMWTCLKQLVANVLENRIANVLTTIIANIFVNYNC